MSDQEAMASGSKSEDRKHSTGGNHKKVIIWSVEEDRKLFGLFKEHGATWSAIAKEFEGRTESQVKNRFYSTLRRVATRRGLETHAPPRSSIHLSKLDLLQYIDEAIESGHTCFSKRGRRKKHGETAAGKEIRKECPGQKPGLAPLPTFARLARPCPIQPVPLIPQPQTQIYAGNCGTHLCPQIFQTGMRVPMVYPPARIYCAPTWGQPQTSVGVQTKLEELVLLQQSVIRMLLQQPGSAMTAERSTGLKK